MSKIKFNQKLLFKIFSLILLSTISVSIIVGSFSFSFTEFVTQKFIMKNELEIAAHTMNEIDRALYERYLDIQAIAGEDSLERYVLDCSRGVSVENEKDNGLKRMRDLAIVSGPWDVLTVNDRNGNIVLSTNEKEIGLPIAHEQYSHIAHEAAMKGKIYYSDVALSDDTGNLMVVFAAPIKDILDPLKPIIGTVVGHFSWMVVLQILDETSTNAILVGRDGKIIGSNQEEAAGGVAFNRSLVKAMTSEISRGTSKSVIISRDRGVLPEDTLVSLAIQKGYLSYQGSGWSLVLSQPARVAFAPASKSAGQIALALLLMIILISGVILFVAQQMMIHPISILTDTIHDISSGDLTKRVAVTSNDEIGQLGTAFNDMTRKIQEYQQDLEEKIKQRTGELQESHAYNRSIIETATDAFVGMDGKGIITDWNHQAVMIFGWTRAEAMGRSLTDTVIPSQYREAHAKGLKHFLETGQGPVLNQRVELTALHRDGHEFPVELTIWAIRVKDRYQFNAFIHDITIRRQGEETREKLHRQMKLILESAGEGIFGLNLEGEHTFVNQAAVQILGYKEEELIGKNSHALWHYKRPNGMPFPSEECPIYATLHDGVIHHGEEYFWRKDGTGFPVAFSSIPMKQKGEIIGAVVSFFDIADRKKFEKTIQESEKRFRAIYDGSNDAIMLLTEKGFIDCNKCTLGMFGFETKEDFCRVHPGDVSPPFQANGRNSYSEAQARIQTAFEKGSYQFEWLHLRKNGEVFPAEVLLSAFDLEGNRVLQATVRDISERRRTEKQLRQLYQAVEQSPNSIVITDTAGNIEYVNPKFVQVTGYSQKEVIGQTPRILKSGKTSPQEYERLWKAISSGREWHGTLQNRKKSGELFWELVAISPMKNEKGEITHYLGIKEDITEQKKMADELQVNFEDLKQFQQATIDRENRMIELKKEINKLSQQVGKPPPYDLSFLES